MASRRGESKNPCNRAIWIWIPEPCCKPRRHQTQSAVVQETQCECLPLPSKSDLFELGYDTDVSCRFKDLVPDTNYYEHEEFVRGIGAGLFWDPESLGVVFQKRFELVPLPAVALILTMVCC
jgi:hypothetical protein